MAFASAHSISRRGRNTSSPWQLCGHLHFAKETMRARDFRAALLRIVGYTTGVARALLAMLGGWSSTRCCKSSLSLWPVTGVALSRRLNDYSSTLPTRGSSEYHCGAESPGTSDILRWQQ